MLTNDVIENGERVTYYAKYNATETLGYLYDGVLYDAAILHLGKWATDSSAVSNARGYIRDGGESAIFRIENILGHK